MKLTDSEKAFLDGGHGKAPQKAMELLVRYAEALGAERFVDTNNVCGVPGSANPFLQNYYKDKGTSEHDAIFSFFDLDADELVDAPQALVSTCCLQGGADPDNWETLGTKPQVFNIYKDREQFAADRGVKILKTCTPYVVGNTPRPGEHCAWMESSAVVYCNSVLGARTNTEGKESTGAAALTGRIPYWGYHITQNRRGTHLVEVDVAVDDIMDWGLLGYWLGEIVQEDIPVLTGKVAQPSLIKLKHFGAAAASSGGVEMYHIPGVTPEANSTEEAFAGRKCEATLRYGAAERKLAHDTLNCATDRNVDFVMLGCP